MLMRSLTFDLNGEPSELILVVRVRRSSGGEEKKLANVRQRAS